MNIASPLTVNRPNAFNNRVDQRTPLLFPRIFTNIFPWGDTSQVDYRGINKEKESKAEQSDLFGSA